MEDFEIKLDKIMQNIDTSKQTPIEIALKIDENGETTARALYEFLDLDKSHFSRWAEKNIENNEYYDENVDWWGFAIVANGNKCKDYRLTTDFAKHLCMESHSKKGKVAKNYFVQMENKVKQDIANRKNLSPELQMIYAMLDVQAKQELEQKRQAQQINQVEHTVTTMREIFVQPIGDWQAEINRMVREISIKSGIAFPELWSKLYGELEITAKCSLKKLVMNKRNRLEKAGNTKKAISDGTTKLAVIHDNVRLKKIFEGIVKKHAMVYLAGSEVQHG